MARSQPYCQDIAILFAPVGLVSRRFSVEKRPSASKIDITVFIAAREMVSTSSAIALSDIDRHWAKPFIEGLVSLGIVRGFPDGTYRPEQIVTRAELAALVSKAFDRAAERPAMDFTDVPADHWAAPAIRTAYERGFLAGYPGGRFAPSESALRVQVIVSLVNGLDLRDRPVEPKDFYRDADRIPNWAIDEIGVATSANLVVSYPETNLLQPQRGATRAEVAAILYQALVNLGRATPIESPYIVRSQEGQPPTPVVPTVSVSHPREFRGVWFASVWNINWPSRRDLSTAQQKDELIDLLDRASEAKLNAIVLQVRPDGDALYASQLEPWSFWLTGRQGQAPNPFYDPLEFAVTEAHKRGLQLHAWFNPYRARSSSQTTLVRPHIGAVHPEVVYRYGNTLWMDPSIPLVQNRTYEVIMDVTRRYDVDGIHLDDYFYPYPQPGVPFPDNNTYRDYRNRGGTLPVNDWRRDNVNRMVERLYKGIKSVKSHVSFGISPFGIYRPGQPPQVTGLDQYDALFADPLKWQREGWVDYLAPQLYWPIDQYAQSFSALLEWWTQNNPQNRHIYAGMNLVKLGESGWTVVEFDRQVALTRRWAEGGIYYNMDPLLENRLGILDYFRNTLYKDPAIVPTQPWVNSSPPQPPEDVRVVNNTIVWKPAAGHIRAWTIYQKNGDNWKLLRIRDASVKQTSVFPGTYAVCSVDRFANESRGVVVAVS